MAKECTLSTGKLPPGDLSRNSVARITDGPDMTSPVKNDLITCMHNCVFQAYYNHARGMVHHNLKMEAKAAKKAAQQFPPNTEVYTDQCNTTHLSK